MGTTPIVKYWSTVRRQGKAYLDHAAIFKLIIRPDSDGLACESANCVPLACGSTNCVLCAGQRCWEEGRGELAPWGWLLPLFKVSCG